MTREPNYIKLLREHGYLDGKPGLTHVHVDHQAGCADATGGVCNCDPKLTITQGDTETIIDAVEKAQSQGARSGEVMVIEPPEKEAEEPT